MGELRGGSSLTEKPVAQGGLSRHIGRQQLDRNRPVQGYVAGQEHDSHSTATEFAFEGIAAGYRYLKVEEFA